MPGEFTFKGKLVASRTDCMSYSTYVFENLDRNEDDECEKYVMCTRFPNWQEQSVDIGDVGFVTVRHVIAGKDTWFDGVSDVPYKYTDVHFLKFVPNPTPATDVRIVL